MADVNDVKSISELLTQVTEGFSHFFTNMESALEKIAGIPNLLNTSNDSLKKTTEAAKETSSALDTTHAISLNLIDSIKEIGVVSLETFKAIGSGSRESIANLGDLNEGVLDVISSINLMSLGAPDAFDKFSQSSKSVTSDISGSLEPTFNKLIDTLSKYTEFPLLNTLKNVGTTVMPAIDSVNNLENSLLALHGSSGDLVKVFEETGLSESNLTNLTNEFNNNVIRTAQNTGASIPSIIAFSGEILKIPELYNKIINTDLSGDINFVEAAMKVARGTTQNYADVMGVVKNQYENMNVSGEKSLQLMSRMFGVTQTLGIPFDYVSAQVKSASEQFKFLGDNTQGALNIIEGLSPKLLASGLGPKAVQELVGGVINSISQLDVAQKSLLSSKTGGPGGLQGGFQIDQLLAEGKVDEVYKKMEATLRQQFGGKITTLKEGTESQAGAAQLQKEVSFLTQGPFGSLVKNSAEAYKLLESFKAGQTPTQPKTEIQLKEGLNKTIDTGREIDQLQYTELQKIANGIEAIRIFSAQTLGQSTRELTKVELNKEQTNEIPFRYSGPNNPDAKTNVANIGADIVSATKKLYNDVASKLSISAVESKAVRSNIVEQNKVEINTIKPNIPEPTEVEINAARPNNNLTPTLPESPDKDAAKQRENILKSSPVPGTVLASTSSGDQTITIKLAQKIDGKDEERILATAQVQAIKAIKASKDADNSSAIVGHN